ncbi:hypothetical protein AQUCO_01800209v1 [Aquilegia coerulea]|uniref:RING-type E3 ubiquitin transferase n=1 Tax=Aquilegia coerulea TaxID=218851 RepID=A0A2G5DKH2_AQUCA|nr:hypothetical protein AQUCO_01800209v1 [Aquilegia coerulea]
MAGPANSCDSLQGDANLSVLSSEGIEFLISGEGKVPLSSLNQQTICLYFSADWCRPCKTFTPQLVQLYNTLRSTRKELQIIFVSFDRDESSFLEHFKCMPWLAVPFNVNTQRHLCNTYHVNCIPSLIPLGSNGRSVEEDAVALIEDYGIDAFPFTRERKEELKSFDNTKRNGGNIEDLLVYGQRDYVIAADGEKTLVSELIGKTIGLFFGAHWCPPSRAFAIQLAEVYNELKINQNKGFEIVFVSTDRDQEEFDLNISTMTWLAIPYQDKARQDLSRIFDIKGIPALVIIGPDGKTLSTNGRAMITSYGAKAFPFTASRATEVEAALKMEGDALPQQVKDPKHGHLLKLDMAKAYVCDSCRRQGRFWVYTCDQCDFDLHPECIEEKEMWLQKSNTEKKEDGNGLVAVAIDKDKGSQHALKWAVDNVLSRGQTVLLVHVKLRAMSSLPGTPVSLTKNQIDQPTKDLFLPFRCFCTRKDVKCNDVVLEDIDVAKALIEYVSHSAIETLVVGTSAKNGLFRRFKAQDIPSTVSKGAPDFCTVYIITKNKIASVRSASRPAPSVSPLRAQMQNQVSSVRSEPPDAHMTRNSSAKSFEMTHSEPRHSNSQYDEMDFIKSPFTRGSRMINGKSYCSEPPYPETDISFVSSGRPSTERMFPSLYDQFESGRTPRLSNSSDMDLRSFESIRSANKSPDHSFTNEYSSFSQESGASWSSSQNMEDVEAEMRRLKLELKQTMDMYSTACKEALTAKQKAMELHRWKMEEEQRLEEARMAEEAALSIAEREKAKCWMLWHNLMSDTETVAIKVLRPDAAQGRSQFQQEIEVLSCIRHPNMVLLLGACPEYGCLVYEYMANGSLDDRLFCRGNTRVLSWQLRFRIAAEIGTGLLFLHQTKPEPLVHRDLKPGNILLDRNFVSKISDVGLARLVPPSVANHVTQYRMTSTAGTFCYIDPEYQQTGMLGIKSDIYSLGIMLLQLITAKNPMGLAHHVERAIEKDTFADMLDPAVRDWPVEEALIFAKLALRCAELRRKDRPDLGKEVLPELNRLRSLAEENMPNLTSSGGGSPTYSRMSAHQIILQQDVMSDPMLTRPGDSSKSRSSGSSLPERRSVN